MLSVSVVILLIPLNDILKRIYLTCPSLAPSSAEPYLQTSWRYINPVLLLLLLLSTFDTVNLHWPIV